MDEELFRDYVNALRKMGRKPLLCYKSQANIFLRWISSKGISVRQLTPEIVNDFLCYRKVQSSAYHSLGTVWHRLTFFLRYLHQKKIVDRSLTEAVSCAWLDVPGGLPAYQGVLRKIFTRPFPMCKYRLPLFAPHWEKYLQHLLDQGYRRGSLQSVLGHNNYFHDYLVRRGISSLTQVTAELLNSFVRQREILFRRKYGCSMPPFNRTILRGSVENFLTYALGLPHLSFRKPRIHVENPALPDKLLNAYLAYCRDHRGLKATTQEDHLRELEQLGAFLERKKTRDIKKITIAELDAYCVHRLNRINPRTMRGMLARLRSFFGFLHLNGDIPKNPARDLYSPCRFQADTYPKHISWNKILDMFEKIDRSHPRGKREYALLMLMAHHGLRAREVAKLKLSDINWADSSLLLRERKNGITSRIPLSPITAQALRDYLTVRPACSYEEVFLTVLAPIKPLGRGLFAVACRRLYRHFGHSLSGHGSTRLRHSFAKALLDQGAPLPDIGVLMGHRSLMSTFTYTRIATEELREVADNYADLL